MTANVQHYGCWKFAGRLLDRVNTPLMQVSAPAHAIACRRARLKNVKTNDRLRESSAESEHSIYTTWLYAVDV